MSKNASEVDWAPYLERCFLFDATEDSYAVDAISGEIPDWLRGTYYINGPARFERAGIRYNHWLDGDGMVCALRLDSGAAWFTNRFVRTRKFQEEETAGRPIYRGFGTSFPGDRLRRGLMLEPPVNVSVYPYAGTLLAFGEQSLPFQLDPVTLQTIGEYDFGGSLTEVTPFAAHPKWDPTTGHMVNFGVSFSPSHPAINIYEFDARGRQVRRRHHPLRYAHSNHDFGISSSFAIFYLSPLLMDFNRFWESNLSVVDSLVWAPEKGSRILVTPRKAGSQSSFEVEIGHGHCLHLINCFESECNLLTVDVLEMEAPAYPEYQPMPNLFRTATRCRPVRYLINTAAQALVKREALEYDRGPDFPAIDRGLTCRPYDDFWMLGISAIGTVGRKFFDQLAHGNWSRKAVDDVYQVRQGEYLAGEPLYVSNPDDSGDAVIITEFIDAHQDRSEVLLFKAAKVAGGPIARLRLRRKIHLGFHTSFHPAPKP